MPKEFKKWTYRNLNSCYSLYNAFGEINCTLFQKYPEYFELTLDIKARLKLKPDEFRTGKYPITFPKQYYVQGPASINSTQAASKMDDVGCVLIEEGDESPDTALRERISKMGL